MTGTVTRSVTTGRVVPSDGDPAALAQELRGPLGAIRNALYLLSLARDEAGADRARRMAERQVDRLVALLDALPGEVEAGRAAAPDDPPEDPPAPAPGLPPPKVSAGPPCRVLVVGETAAAEGLARLAEADGHPVRVADDPAAAARMAAVERPGVVLLDADAAECDWRAVARRLRDLPAGPPPVVAVTARPAAVRPLLAAAGVAHLLARPVGPDEWDAMLRGVTGRV